MKHAAENNTKDNADAGTDTGYVSRLTAPLIETRNPYRKAVQELINGCQDLAAKNAAGVGAAMQALLSARTPFEYLEVQQRLLREGFQAALSDGRHLAQLGTAVTLSPFESMKQRIAEVRKASS
jgi:phasin family protein